MLDKMWLLLGIAAGGMIFGLQYGYDLPVAIGSTLLMGGIAYALVSLVEFIGKWRNSERVEATEPSG